MADALKIDSNATGLRYTREESVGVLPADPVWKTVEPNSYDDFGAEIKTVARKPINDRRNRKKGVVVDVDAGGGFDMDITQENTADFMEGFLFAAARTHAELDVADVDGTGNDYNPTADGDDYFAGNLLFAKNFTSAANNGLKKVTGTPTGTSVAVTDTSLVDENGADGIISRVGHEFGTAVAAIDASGDLPKLTVTGNAAAARVLTFTDQPLDTETVTIGSTVYTFQDTLTNVAGNVKIGADLAASIVNLKNAINRNGLGTPGTDFATATSAHPTVSVTAFNGTTMTATARKAGTAGNAIATTETLTDASWAGVTLAGGTGVSLLDYGLSIGLWVCVGDDATANKFATAANNGLKRIRLIEDSAITFDKSTSTMVTDAGTGKDIRVIWGRSIRDEAAEDQVRTSYQFERSLGAPDTAQPTQIQAEYLTGSIANEFELNVEQGDKLTASLSFMSRDSETRTAAEGRKDGTRPVLQEADALNATSHVKRLSLAIIDETDASPDDLFAYVTDLTLSINNNVKANKAVKVLGAFDNTAGTFEVDANCTAYFQKVEAIQSVRDNADVTLDLTFAQANKGITIDLPLISIGGAMPEVEADEPIMLPLEQAAASGSKIDPELAHTMLIEYWDYLPDLAA